MNKTVQTVILGMLVFAASCHGCEGDKCYSDEECRGVGGSKVGVGACEYGYCREGACHYKAIPDCCVYDTDCDDADECTTDTCADIYSGTETGECSHSNLCCKSGAECDDQDACTADSCEDEQCVHTSMDCDDGLSCTKDSCADGVCVNEDVDCCEDATSCDDLDPCTVDSCSTDLACEYVQKLCCTPCEDGKDCAGECLTGECVEGVCVTREKCCCNGECEVIVEEYPQGGTVETCADCPEDCPEGTGTDCCTPDTTEGGGCTDDGIRDCVCAVDSACCEVSWTATCVNEVGALGCGDACPCLKEL